MEIALIIVAAVVVLLFISAVRRNRIYQARHQIADRIAHGASLSNVLGKIKYTINMFASSIEPSKLLKGTEETRRYYFGYINEVSRSIALRDGVDYSDLVKTSVYMEVRRITGRPTDEGRLFDEAPALLDELLQSDAAKQGSADGAADGAYATVSTNPGPYFTRLLKRFDVSV